MKITVHESSGPPTVHPAYQGRATELRKALMELKPGQCLVLEDVKFQYIYRAAAQLGIKVTCRKMEDGTRHVWRRFDPWLK